MKKLNKWLLIGSSILAGTGIFVSSLAYKLTHPFKPSFFNYKSYISKDNHQILSKEFDYKEFDEINQFTIALTNNKAVAGIGSDFQAVKLVQDNLINKIDYSVLLNDPSLKGNYQKTKQAVKSLIRPVIWDHLATYDHLLTKENKGELWEYFLPYFSQDMVISYNINKIHPPKENLLDDEEIDFEKYRNQYQDKLYDIVNLLKILKANNFNHWLITDAVRDNMLYGSSYWKNADGTRTDARFTGEVKTSTYKELIDAFTDLIKDGTGYSVKSSNIAFNGDGLEIVNNLINPRRKDVNAAIMYNGDALDAYYGADNFENLTEDGWIRSVKPKQNILLVDGLVIAKDNSEKENEVYLKNIGESIYSNLKIHYKELKDAGFLDQNASVDMTTKTETLVNQYWKDLKINELEQEDYNFDQNYNLEQFINKYAAIIDLNSAKNIDFKNEFMSLQQNANEENFDKSINIYPYMIQKYLLDNESQLLTKLLDLVNQHQDDLSKVLEGLGNETSVIATLLVNNLKENPDNLKTVLEQKTNNDLEGFALELGQLIAYIDLSNEETIKGWHNLINFNFVNYVPTQEVDYEFILRNYFATPFEGQDKIAIDIFKIESKKGRIEHKSIMPVDNKLQSLITSYYFEKTKS
ncbi:hypothetical protein GE118_02440 [Mycoplasma sp. NEAQ87857]|uniref:hypothetical protein n=1 Tax=Mycoplasma sp. NEAQ87857 TaxID=2683967 RepID=UPI00131792F2|nr:hypothetical protein [Mycoplasma sp. NEAQ87857]QGZ97653.1 hypothetical protein GE118_02440 [Mycoplasma sp. NEAQ87857]